MTQVFHNRGEAVNAGSYQSTTALLPGSHIGLGHISGSLLPSGGQAGYSDVVCCSFLPPSFISLRLGKERFQGLDVVNRVPQYFHLWKSLIGRATRVLSEDFKCFVHLSKPFSLSHGGCMSSVNPHRASLASPASPNEALSSGMWTRVSKVRFVFVLLPFASLPPLHPLSE